MNKLSIIDSIFSFQFHKRILINKAMVHMEEVNL